MPLPKPKKDTESKKDFLKRCMAAAIMIEEYEDENQRYAICNSLWEQNKEGKIMFEDNIERRILSVDGLEVREAKNDEGPKMVGYAARFNQLSDDLGGFREKIKSGAFAKTIKEDDVRALFNHDSNFIIGRTSAGTLNLFEDKKGLRMEVELPDTQWAKDLAVSVERGDITQQSFSFNARMDKWDERDKDNIIRTLEDVQIFDVGPVTFPAYPQTTVQMRSLEQVLKTAGLDISVVNRALLKHEHNLELTDDDQRAIDEVIVRLKAISQRSEQNAGTRSDNNEEPMHLVTIRRRNRELDLLENDC